MRLEPCLLRKGRTEVTDWQQVVRDHSPAIWKTAYRLVGNQDDAADCVQETFLAAMRLGNSKTIEHWGAFLHRIAAARALDCLRKRYQTSARREPVPPDWNSLPDNRPDPQRMAQNSELVQKLLQALVELPKLQAEAFCLRWLSQLEYREIAESLEINPNSVGALLHRARESLRQMLSHVVAPEQ
jgi:RNA polymerase sigma-70 factor (ECF subfamily)